jgi:prophage maintenance system killer protein
VPSGHFPRPRRFLHNGFRLRFDPLQAVQTMESVAAGALAEDALADWFRQHTVAA